jgi:TRAP-type C4-dicarboxylate transport system permease small subunit
MGILNVTLLSVVCIFCVVLGLGGIQYFIVQRGMFTQALHIPFNLFTVPLILFAFSTLLDSFLDLSRSAPDIIRTLRNRGKNQEKKDRNKGL